MIHIKKKIINFLTKKGKKPTAEKVFIKAVKTLQQDCAKSTKELIKLAVFNSIIPFRILTFKQKKRKKKKIREVPFYIKNYKDQLSFAIKNLSKAVHTKNQSLPKVSHNDLKNEILSATKSASNSIQIKENIQAFLMNKKHLLRHYKW